MTSLHEFSSLLLLRDTLLTKTGEIVFKKNGASLENTGLLINRGVILYTTVGIMEE